MMDFNTYWASTLYSEISLGIVGLLIKQEYFRNNRLNFVQTRFKYKIMATCEQLMEGCNSVAALDAIGGQETSSCHIMHSYDQLASIVLP